MPTASQIQQAVNRLPIDSQKLHDIIHGGVDTVVTTDNGPVKSIANLQREFKLDAGDVIDQATALKNSAQGFRNEAEGFKNTASSAAATAALAADTALALTRLYPNTTAGLAAVSEGEYFAVAGTGNTYATLYREVSGVAVQIAQYASKAAIDSAVSAALTNGSLLLSDIPSLTIDPRIKSFTIAGISEVGDSGAGLTLVANPLVDAAYVAAHPHTSVRDVTGQGFSALLQIEGYELIGWYGNSLVDAPYSAPEIPAPAMLETNLRALGYNVLVLNEGRSGETTPEILYRMQRDFAAGFRPKVVILGPATVNNWRRVDDDPAIYGQTATRADVLAMAALAHSYGAYVIALSDAPWKGYVDTTSSYSWSTAKQALTDNFNTWLLAGIANVDKQFDLYTATEGAADTMAATYDRGDKLHFNNSGRAVMVSLVQAAVAANIGSRRTALEIHGAEAAIDQRLTRDASPTFNGGLTVGDTQGGFALFGPAFSVKLAPGVRRINAGTADNAAIARGMFLDGLMPILFQSITPSVVGGSYRLQARISIREYGSGAGKLTFGASNGSQIVDAMFVTGDGFVGIGTDTPFRPFVVSKDGKEGLEIAPGETAGIVKVLAYNRQTNQVIDVDAQANWTFKSGDGVVQMTMTNAGVRFPNLAGIVQTGGTNMPNFYIDPVSGEPKRTAWAKLTKPTITDPPTKAQIDSILDALVAFGIYNP